MPRKLAKRACQRCEYLNPRQALYCLRCGEIFRPVLAETPWQYLRPEIEQRRAEALGKVALESMAQSKAEPAGLQVALACLLLGFLLVAAYYGNSHRVLRRMTASPPSSVSYAIWKVHRPEVERPKRPLFRPKAALRTLRDPVVPAWLMTMGPLAAYLMVLGLIGLIRREVGQVRFFALFDPFYPIGAFWADLIRGRRGSKTGRRGLTGAPALLVAASYSLWGLIGMFCVPASVYFAELRKEGWDKGLRALGLEVLMIFTYPGVFDVGRWDVGFIGLSLVGHVAYGLTLGLLALRLDLLPVPGRGAPGGAA